MVRRKQEVIALRKWVLSGKKFDLITQCTGCGNTNAAKSLDDLYSCKKCNLDLRSTPSKAHRFTAYKNSLIPVLPWIDPVKTILPKPIKKKSTRRARKSFDD